MRKAMAGCVRTYAIVITPVNVDEATSAHRMDEGQAELTAAAPGLGMPYASPMNEKQVLAAPPRKPAETHQQMSVRKRVYLLMTPLKVLWRRLCRLGIPRKLMSGHQVKATAPNDHMLSQGERSRVVLRSSDRGALHGCGLATLALGSP